MTDLSAQHRPAASADASIGDYWALLKPRVMSLVLFTAVIGLLIAPGDLHPVKALVALLCIALGAGASGALNQWYDADIDAVMTRTAARPIPQGRISADAAFDFGIVLGAGSVFVMASLVSYAAAALLAGTIAFYVVVYTMGLKRRTSQNIVIGGAAGALPPVIGWVAVTGTMALEPWILFAIIFFWTPAHFWALALVRSEDYRRAGVPMLPVTDGPGATRIQIIIYACITAAMGLAPFAIGMAGIGYAVLAAALGLGFVGLAVRLQFVVPDKRAHDRAAMQLFAYSILYLFLIFAALGIDRFTA